MMMPTGTGCREEMAKPFYEFGDEPFIDGLWENYIVPVARWFLCSDKPEGYLLPQFAGSVWECSLAMDFLLQLADNPNLESDLRKAIMVKVVNTTKWMRRMLKKEADGGLSWDSAPWDTAVALKSSLSCLEACSESFTEKEKIDFKNDAISICRWLLVQSENWKAPEGYLTADATDLAVTLSTIITVQKLYPAEYSRIEDEVKREESIDAVADMLLQCVSAPDSDEVKDAYSLSSWGSCFNVGEVVCGLCAYASWGSGASADLANRLVLEGIKYIERDQNLGGLDDTSVADSCGIMWCYVKALGSGVAYGHDDSLLFKKLCWMCDSNKVLDDGSLLHSSYITVFYALFLSEVYRTWELGKKSACEIYHYVVLQNPNFELLERAKRLDLELEMTRKETFANRIQLAHMRRKVMGITLAVVFACIIITLVILQMSNSVTLICPSIADMDSALMIVSIAVAATVGVTTCVHETLIRKYLKRLETAK